jgi:hypothetical protein
VFGLGVSLLMDGLIHMQPAQKLRGNAREVR